MARIIIELDDKGRLSLVSPGVDPLAVIAILEIAKFTLLTQQAKPLPQEPKPSIIVPNVKAS